MTVTYDTSFSLRIGAIFLIFFISLLGYFLPYYIGSRGLKNLENNSYFLYMKSFAAGIILSIAFIHLLADALGDLSSYMPNYPLGLALSLGGIFITLVLDQSAMIVINSINKNELVICNENLDDEEHRNNHNDHSHHHEHCELEMVSGKRSTDGDNLRIESSCEQCDLNTKTNPELEVVGQHDSSDHFHDHSHTHTKRMLADKSGKKAFIKSIVLEISMAIHSILLGLSFGAMTQNEIDEIRVLMAALTIHQFFEGFSLGSAIVETKLKFRTIFLFGLFFASMLCIGAAIGINLPVEEATAATDESSHEEDHGRRMFRLQGGGHNEATDEEVSQSTVIQACFLAVASGMLIYSGLVEMVAEDFSSTEISEKPKVKFMMIVFFALGIALLAILGIWA